MCWAAVMVAHAGVNIECTHQIKPVNGPVLGELVAALQFGSRKGVRG